MDKKYDISLPKPRKPEGYRPPGFPPIGPKQNIINVNVNDNDDLINYAVLSSLQVINSRLTAVENKVNDADFTKLELGESEGTAYPGNKGYSNATAITLISNQLQNFITQSALQTTLREALADFATIGAMNAMLDGINRTIDEKLSGNIDNENVSAVVSAIASTVINNYHSEENADYSDILNNTNSLLDELGD